MFKNLHDLLKGLPDEISCRQYFEQYRWEDGKPVCPYCGSGKAYRIEKGRRFKCGNSACYKKYSVLVGTIFEASNIPLQKWFIALYIMTSHKKGISSCQLARDIGITQKSAWFMLQRLRLLMHKGNSQEKFTDVVQADEAFFGGKNKNRHAVKRVDLSQGRAYKDKTPVLGLIEYGQVKLEVIPDTKAETIRAVIKDKVEKGAILVSDEYDAYGWLRGYCFHIKVQHAWGQYTNGAFHTNSIEGFWSHFKRGLYGIYIKVSRKHLHRYCEEFAYRFNSRKTPDGQRFLASLKVKGEWLPYKKLIGESVPLTDDGKETSQIPG